MKTRAGRRRLAWLSIALLIAVSFADDARAWSPPVPIPPGHPGDFGEPIDAPPHAPVDPQLCMSQFLDNVTRCKQIFCHIGFWWWEDDYCDPGFYNCVGHADEVFECCIQPVTCGAMG
ncbi:MAG: hypothetical protein H6825_07870 [Planctomycetes bacterium]|nr:hypothetical protein [Planctomycetota bacterium]